MKTEQSEYNDFMSKHNVKNGNGNGGTGFTHTRMPDKELNIYPGSYCIPSEELSTFYNLYYEYVFTHKHKEYLTEKQLENAGAMVVDFDFRYHYDVIERQHTPEHISDMICEYLEELDLCYLIGSDISFFIYVFEKPNVNRLSDKSLTKDGIHMLIGVQVDYSMQQLIRNRMMERLSNTWDMPLINGWDSVLDEGISTGKTNWQLFGSKKPNHQAYELTSYYKISKDPTDGKFCMEQQNIEKFDLKTNFAKLSVQYDKNPKFEINPSIANEYAKYSQKSKSKNVKASNKIKKKLIIEDDEEEEEMMTLYDIKTSELLEKAMKNILKNLNPNEYEIAETHMFTQVLPEKYYNPGSHLLNRQVAFALKHTDERLFLSWVMLRSKASDFDYNCIPELYETWQKFHNSNTNNQCVTRKSIMYWAKQDNPEEFKKIKQTTANFYVEKAIETATEYDIALVLKQMYKDKFVCVSFNNKGIWYQFKNHRWVIDHGLALRGKISTSLCGLFQKNVERIMSEIMDCGENPEKTEVLKKKQTKIMKLILKLGKTADKNNIIREAAELFYDEDFTRNMDTKKHLMCFKNGIIDFKEKVFRDGLPEDYITKTTNIEYIPFPSKDAKDAKDGNDANDYNTKKEFLLDFMQKLFPIEDLNKYMWDHLSSCLIGSNKNQTFNIYHGSGSNGKSIIADLMSVTLGEYKGTVPITLITEKRGLIGCTSDEVLKLKGIRYAVMQEPSKAVKMNEGIMKELTGGDPIQARGLYKESEVFEPQFNLVVCTNSLFDIESNDDGTWRRIRKCEFLSKFVDNTELYKEKSAYIFDKDKTLKEKLPSLAPVFASMLVKRAFETDGIIEDCETVMNASMKYRKSQDHIDAFISENIIHTGNPEDILKKSGINQQYKRWVEENQGSRKNTKADELYDAIQKKYDNIKLTKKGWVGLKFIEPEDGEEL